MFVITLTTKRGLNPMEGELRNEIILHIAGDGVTAAAEVDEMARQLEHVRELLT